MVHIVEVKIKVLCKICSEVHECYESGVRKTTKGRRKTRIEKIMCLEPNNPEEEAAFYGARSTL